MKAQEILVKENVMSLNILHPPIQGCHIIILVTFTTRCLPLLFSNMTQMIEYPGDCFKSDLHKLTVADNQSHSIHNLLTTQT